MEYKIIKVDEESGKHLLEEMVNGAIEEGFEPMGGISIRVGTVSGAYFLQAMIKRDKCSSE